MNEPQKILVNILTHQAKIKNITNSLIINLLSKIHPTKVIYIEKLSNILFNNNGVCIYMYLLI